MHGMHPILPRRGGDVPKRTLRLALLIWLVVVLGMESPIARANSYNGLLSAGQVYDAVSAQAYSANTVLRSESWTAPNGVQFGGFAYTTASFVVSDADSTGGLSAGFTGSGGSVPGDVNFPLTNDCSVSEETPPTWIANGAQVKAGATGPGGVAGGCDSSGTTSSWTSASSEMESTNTSQNPQSDFQVLKLEIWCASDTNCSNSDSASFAVTNLSGHFDDSLSRPSGTASWNTAVSGSSWYQTDDGGLALNVSADDPAGVCSMSASVSGPSSAASGPLGNGNPAVTDVGGVIGQEFQFGTDPCWAGSTDRATWTLPAGLASGTYAPSLEASNPGNYESQGFSPTGAPVVATASDVNIDDAAPQLTWSNAPSGWTSQTAETLDVVVGPSGLSALSCADNGTPVTPILTSGAVTGAGLTVWTVPTAVNGSDAVSCTATNGDANGSLAGNVTTTFHVDATVPSFTFQDPGYHAGSWTNASQVVTVVPVVGLSGLASLACTLDGQPANLTGNDELTVTGNSAGPGLPHVVSCYAVSRTNETDQGDPATFRIAIDTDIPTVTFSGAPAGGQWVPGTPTVVVTGAEMNTVTDQAELLSGVATISCTVNGQPVDTPPLTAGYATSFQLTANGANRISCVPTTVAGTRGQPFAETVNVANPTSDCPNSRCALTSHGSSPLVDDGADPFSNGPSQSAWYRTPSAVRITANLPSDQAPVEAISCTGALTGHWPRNGANTDAAGGEQITITVPPPGGQLSCTATDAASNVYQLGSYQFEEDDTPPAGEFNRLSVRAPDDIRLTVDDPGGSLASGVGAVRVYATNTGTGEVYGLGLAQAVPGRAHVYEVNLDDADVPAGLYRFDARAGDIAGNTADITAGPQGRTTVWQLPLRDSTALTLRAGAASGAVDAAVPPALQADVPNTSTDMPGVGSVLRPRHGQRGVGTRPARAAGTPRRHLGAGSARDRRGPEGGAVVSVRYGAALIITGTLRDLRHHNRPIPGAVIRVWGQIGHARPVLLGRTRTGRAGSYRARVAGGASRRLFVTYAGTRRTRAAVAHVDERFLGRVLIHTSPAPPGGRLTISGRVTGGHVPARGINITVEGAIVGYPGSQQLGTVHTDATGRYRYSITMPRATRGLTYRLWLVVQSRLNPGWPFLGARSRTLTRRVS